MDRDDVGESEADGESLKLREGVSDNDGVTDKDAEAL